MSKLKACPACGKEVAASAKSCPHCGKKLKMGLWPRIGLALLIFGVLTVIFGPSEEEQAAALATELSSLRSASAASISPRGELAEAFVFGSDYTDIQRENMEAELIGKVVQWRLPVYEVSKQGDNRYRVQTGDGGGYVGTFLVIHTASPEEKAYVEGLKTGDAVSIKGKITGTTMRNIDIDPAILVR
jgi:hypothetical protein